MIRRGQIVAVEFDDHCVHGSELFRCVVYGRIAKVGRKELCIDAWEPATPETPPNPANVTRFTIARSTIRRIDRLVKE